MKQITKGRLSRLPALLGVVAATAALAACGSDSSEPPTAASAPGSPSGSGVATAKAEVAKYQEAPTKITLTTPLDSKPPSGKTVVMLGTADPNNVIIQNGVKELAKLVGWNYSLVSYDPANPATFGAAVDTALSKGADYLFEAGLPLAPAVTKKVQDAGAKWVLSAVHPAEIKSPVLANAADCSHDQLQGKLVADFMVADSGGKAHALIEHVEAYPILGCFTDAFTARVKELCPACTTELVNITIPDLAAGKVPSRMVSALRSKPDTNYLVFDVGPFANGVVSALKAAGLDGKVKILGEAADQAAIAALKDGSNTAWTGYDSGYLAYSMFDAALRDSVGMQVDQAESGKAPLQLLTKDNVPSGAEWSEPQDALEQFKQLWHIG
jgi:ribose transport system substrate-binding protein